MNTACSPTAGKETLFIPAVVARYALERIEEILTILRQQAREIQGDDWPDDYDPNDISVYENLLPELRQGVENGYEECYWWGKPVSWMMSSLIGLLKTKPDIPAEDKALIARTLCEYYLREAFWVWESPFTAPEERDWAKQKETAVSRYTKKTMELMAVLTNDFAPSKA